MVKITKSINLAHITEDNKKIETEMNENKIGSENRRCESVWIQNKSFWNWYTMKKRRKPESDGNGECRSEEERAECWLRAKGDGNGAWRWMLGPVRERATDRGVDSKREKLFSLLLTKPNFFYYKFFVFFFIFYFFGERFIVFTFLNKIKFQVFLLAICK